ncbi:MAG TPA: hypothetical protein VIC29_03760 [Steroidobacteraceae bacterium]
MRPTALLLDLWLDTEATRYLRERDVRALIAQHIKAPGRPEVGPWNGPRVSLIPTQSSPPIRTT